MQPVGEIVAGWDILRGAGGGGLMEPQPATIAVSATATGQHDRRFRMAESVARTEADEMGILDRERR
jgi:hypothetical protein